MLQKQKPEYIDSNSRKVFHFLELKEVPPTQKQGYTAQNRLTIQQIQQKKIKIIIFQQNLPMIAVKVFLVIHC